MSVEIRIETGEEELEIQDGLLKLIMKKEWKKAVDFCKTNPRSLETKLTIYDETALHIAVSRFHSKSHSKSHSHADYIKQMIDFIKEEHGSLIHVLSMQNVRGDTPLHLAAAVGWTDICQCIASKDPEKLISIRNVYGETPLFMSAHHGKLEAFLCLHQLYKNVEKEPDYRLCRRKDGNTILHKAISGDYFRLAHQIISYYPNLITSINVDGESPLHFLARKPNVFKRSSQLNLYESIVYKCVFVDELKPHEDNPEASQNGHSLTRDTNPPENCRTGVNTNAYKSISGISPSHKNQNSNPADEENQLENRKAEKHSQGDGAIPANDNNCTLLHKFAKKAIEIVTGGEFWWIRKIREKKQRHLHAFQITNELIDFESRNCKYYSHGKQKPSKEWTHADLRGIMIPYTPSDEDDGHRTLEITPHASVEGTSTPLLVAAKCGIPEMVKKIINAFPVAIQDLDSDGKNVLMIAAENRQAHVFDYLLNLNLPEYMFHQVDNEGNSILHLAAKMGDFQPWEIPGAALHVQWEIKWYMQVKRSIPPFSFARYNNEGKASRKIFAETHEKLVEEGTVTLKKTSESCSVIAALVATVAFASSATVPGGIDDHTGHPVLADHTAFDIFSITSLVALCLSVASLVFFLTIITARFQQRDFYMNLPTRLFTGLTCLFGSIIAMMVSFFAGHTFILSKKLKLAAIPIYSITSLPIMLFAIAYLPFYIDLVNAACRNGPLRSYKVFSKQTWRM